MKQTMRYIVAMAAVLWMAIPQVKAQGLQEDHDPGIMYILRNEGIHIPFQEGNEWEITFTAIDTLGNEYYSPVGMEIKGGVDEDSTYVVMQTVDSIVMYQPKPVMQPGVFEITRDYFPYIAQVDSITTIHFNKNIPLPLPVVGQKVVCNIFEEPLRIGFIGTVLEINEGSTEIVMVCDPKVERIKEFYQHLIYSGGGGHSAEEAAMIREISKVRRIRRDVVVGEPISRVSNEYHEIVGGGDFSLETKPLTIAYTGTIVSGVTVGISGSATVGLKANVNMVAIDDEERGLIINMSITPSITAELKAAISRDIPIPGVGYTVESPYSPFNSKIKGSVGLYVHAEGSASLSSTISASAKLSFAYLYNPNKDDWNLSVGGKLNSFSWSGITLNLSAALGLRVGLMGEAKILSDEQKFETLANIVEVSGKAQFSLIDNFEETPEKLKSEYGKFATNNDVAISAVGARLSVQKKGASGVSFSNTLKINLLEWHAPLQPNTDMSVSKNIIKNEVVGDTRLNKLVLTEVEKTVLPSDALLYVYDVDKKDWESKTLLTSKEFFSKFDFTYDYYLKMGNTYTLYPVYDMAGINPMTDGAIAENLYIPYYMEMEKINVDNYETVGLKAKLCEAGVKVVKEKNGEVGFEYKTSTEEVWQNSAKGSIENGSIVGEIPNPGYDLAINHDVRSYLVVDGKKSYSEAVTFMPINRSTPILLDVSDIKYSSATFNAEVSEDIASKSYWKVGFEYENVSTGVKKEIEESAYGVIGIFSLNVNDLEPSTMYNVRAYTRIDGKDTRYYSVENKTFNTPAPIYDLEAETGYSTADGFYADLTATLLKKIYDNNKDLKFYVAKDKNKIAETDIKGIDVQNIVEIGDEMVISWRAKNLNSKTKYYYRVGAIYQDPVLGTSQEVGSEIEEFTTEDGLGITLSNATVKSNTATVEATVSQYIVDEVNRGNPYTIRFYYGTSSTKVKNRTSEFVEASISSTKVKATIKDLEEETKYYYAAVLYIIEEEGASEVKSFTTPTIFQVETKDAVVEDAMVTLKATISDAALAEMKSENYNTIYPAFDLVTKEHESDLKQGTASANVTRITDLTQDGVNISVDVYLEPGTEYCYRALIYVDGKEYYGSTKSFKTLDYDGGLIPLVRKYRTNASAPWVPIIVKPEERHLAIPLKELIKE